LKEYAVREGYEALEEVTDPGPSGASLARPGLDKVCDLVAAGGVSVVLAQDRDRFAREPAYLYLLREEFAEKGTRLKALTDRGDESPEGELTDGILDQLAKFERAKTAERTRRGRLKKAREGKVIAERQANYGFRYNAGRDGYTVHEEEMRIVRRIFRCAECGRALVAVTTLKGPQGLPPTDVLLHMRHASSKRQTGLIVLGIHERPEGGDRGMERGVCPSYRAREPEARPGTHD
jgi:site-specific DNA recombinase